jgi:HEAT repeat protein
LTASTVPPSLHGEGNHTNAVTCVPVRETLEELVRDDPLRVLDDPRPEIRRLAVGACRRLGAAALGPLTRAARSDDDEHVRAEAVEALGMVGVDAYDVVVGAVADPSPRVVEAAVTALGEIADLRSVELLVQAVLEDRDPLIREAAIAALGAIGDERALPTLLDIVRSGRPQLRRRAVVALTAFHGPEVEAAFKAARLDRNPMVREAAEMVIGRTPAICDQQEGSAGA